ncbi:MAG: tRNA threonylcarbamoyladenosine dehydratase [Firmicutes bacterium]|nr:tRNA threonylcarbamoyladenosine dehydratase [Bacillota bacterium]
MYERLAGLLSNEEINRLNNANILLVGVGGVGSVCFEILIRSGIKNITIVDFDSYEESNLNRQLHSNKNVLGCQKVEVLKNYAQNISEDIKVTIRNEFLTKDSIIDYTNYDYIIDACDSIEAKILLITSAKKHNKKIICSLGVGNRTDIQKLSVNSLRKTVGDPLGKKLRHELNKIDFIDDVKVVSSCEIPIKANPVSSYMSVSASAGILLADAVIKDLINEER